MFTLSTNAFAILPFIYVIPPLLILGAAGTAGLYYYLKPDAPAKVSTTGDITHPSQSQWVDLTAPTPVIDFKDITAHMPLDKLRALADDKTKFPALNGAFNGSSALTPAVGLPIGAIVSTPNGAQAITRIDSSTCHFIPASNPLSVVVNASLTTVTVYSNYDSNGYANSYYKMIFDLPPVNPPIVPYSDNKSKRALAGLPLSNDPLPTDSIVKSDLQSELDKAFQDPSYIPVFTDDTTGLPDIPPDPTHVATPAQIDDYNKRLLASNPTVTTTQGAPVTTNNPDGTSTTVRTTTTTTNGGAGGTTVKTETTTTGGPDGTGPVIKNDTTEDTTGVPVPPALPSDNTYDGLGDSDKPLSKSITDLLGSFTAGSPLVSMVRSFSITTSNASGVVSIGRVYGQDLSFDFTHWESILRACGGVLIIIMHGYCILIVVRGW